MVLYRIVAVKAINTIIDEETQQESSFSPTANKLRSVGRIKPLVIIFN